MWKITAAAVLAGGLFYGVSAPEGPPEGMVRIPAGPATLGAIGKSTFPGPISYDVGEFWIDRYEVTNAEYSRFVNDTGHPPQAFHDDSNFNRPDQPVTGVTWQDAGAFCQWAGKALPSETQWEKAARGTDGRQYPWGNAFDLRLAHLGGEEPAPAHDARGDVSPYGVVNMAGNVAEWSADQRLVGFDCEGGPARFSGDHPLAVRAYLRGGSWDGMAHMAKVHHRLWDYPDTVAEFVGFRCAWTPKEDRRFETASANE